MNASRYTEISGLYSKRKKSGLLRSLFFFLAFFISHVSFCQFSPGYYALKDVNIIDGVSKEVLYQQTIIIRNNKIEKTGPLKEIVIPDSCVVFTYRGKYVMPGLIDTHIHLATEPGKEDNRARAEKDLYAMLLSGVTSVRDMAGDARELASLSRDAITGDILSPDIYYTALMAGPSFFRDPRTHQSTQGGKAGEMAYMKAVTDSTDLRLAVAEARGAGATAIKLYAQLDAELAKKITTEAQHQGMQVWSHADLSIASPLEVINAGVNSISHAGMITRWPSKNIPVDWLKPGLTEAFWDAAFKSLPVEEYIKAMLVNKTVLDATMLVYENRLADTTVQDTARLKMIANWQIAKRFTKLALGKGVPVCAGTDTDENKFVQREIKLLVTKCGFTPMEAIIAATRHGAIATGIEKTTGTIREGKSADLVLLSANPAADITNIDKVVLVIKKGKLINVK